MSDHVLAWATAGTVWAMAAVVIALTVWEWRKARRANTFDPTAAAQRSYEEYRRWADSRVCLGCGKKASERVRDANGVVISGPWATEECCMECFCQGAPPRSEEGYARLARERAKAGC